MRSRNDHVRTTLMRSLHPCQHTQTDAATQVYCRHHGVLIGLRDGVLCIIERGVSVLATASAERVVCWTLLLGRGAEK